jgi:hypothetical protein
MSDVDFLPEWYRQLRHKRRLVALQAWMLAIVVVGLGLWTILAARNAQARETVLNTRKGQLMQSGLELEKLAELQGLKAKMSEQAELVSHLGPHVPIGRLFNAFEQMMPSDMALLDVQFDFAQQERAVSAIDAAAGKASAIQRQLKVKMHGVAPSDVEVGNLMIRLATIPSFGDSSSTTQDLRRENRLMREFTVSFTMNLSDAEQ